MNVAANKRSQSAPMRSAIALRLQWRCQPANQDLSTYVFWVRIWILQLKNVTLKGLPGPFKSQDQSYFHGTKRMSSSPQSNTGHNVCLRCTTGTLVSWLREVQVWSQTHLKHAAFFLSYAQTNKNDHQHVPHHNGRRQHVDRMVRWAASYSISNPTNKVSTIIRCWMFNVYSGRESVIAFLFFFSLPFLANTLNATTSLKHKPRER